MKGPILCNLHNCKLVFIFHTKSRLTVVVGTIKMFLFHKNPCSWLREIDPLLSERNINKNGGPLNITNDLILICLDLTCC